MNRLKLASVVLAAVASTGLVFGSVGFSAVAADRGVSVSVASDDNALVGYYTEDLNVTGDKRVTLVTVANRLSSSASVVGVEVKSNDSAVEVDVRRVPESIPIGENGTVDANVTCQGQASATVTVSVTVEADGVTAAISGDTETRSFEVNCSAAAAEGNAGGAGASDGDARFKGAGKFDFGATDGETVTVTYWTEKKGSGGSSSAFEGYGPTSGVDTAAKFKKEVDEGPKYVAVYVHEWNETYIHPGLDQANGTVDWGTGDAVVEDGRFDPNAD